MDTTTVTIESLASEASSYLHRVSRGEDTITTLKGDRPDWVQDLVHTAHGDFMPDDWRYEAISSALDHIADTGDDEDGASEWADSQVDVYTAARLQWLASNLNRPAYVDQAREDGLISADADTTDQIGVGQYVEAEEVYHLVLGALRERLEELEDADEESNE